MSERMTAARLIEKLSELPPDTPIFVRGYEDGLDDVKCILPTRVVLDYYSEWYYGSHKVTREELSGGVVDGYFLGGK